MAYRLEGSAHRLFVSLNSRPRVIKKKRQAGAEAELKEMLFQSLHPERCTQLNLRPNRAPDPVETQTQSNPRPNRTMDLKSIRSMTRTRYVRTSNTENPANIGTPPTPGQGAGLRPHINILLGQDLRPNRTPDSRTPNPSEV